MPDKPNTHIAIVLDSSGSMAARVNQTIEGFNQQIEAIRAEQDVAAKVTLVTFADRVNFVFEDQPPSELNLLTTEVYRPSGSTALLDAIGHTIQKLENKGAPEDAFLLVIVTDGGENVSKEFNAVAIGEIVQRLQDTGRWTFTYMGANQDLSFIRDDLKIHEGNIALYEDHEADLVATANAYNRAATSGFLRARAMGATAVHSFYSSDNSGQDFLNVSNSSVDPGRDLGAIVADEESDSKEPTP